MEKRLEQIFPILSIEHDVVLSHQGDLTIVYELVLPEVFTLSDREYEVLHQAWVKALRVLPKHSVAHKQDWFTEATYRADFGGGEDSFLARASERFFHERPYLDHHCYLMITQPPQGRKPASFLRSALLGRSPVPEQALRPWGVQGLLDSCGQLERILKDSGLVGLRRLREADLLSTREKAGLLERYCLLGAQGEAPLLRDLSFGTEMAVGAARLQLYTLSDAADLPPLCGPRINYDPYSTDRTRFPVGFAAPLGQLLPCNHIYNQYVFLGDAPKTLQRLERKRLRLQSLSAYSRENALARDATGAFLNEAIAEGRLPVRAHFNVLVWSEGGDQQRELKNLVSSALAGMDAVPREETVGAPHLFWAGVPGNGADLPASETFDTFLEQATCFFNGESTCRSSQSPLGVRLGDRLTGRPLHVDLSDEPLERGFITNRNKFILGPSGSGKSFFTNHLVRSYLEGGTHVVLVDVGHSYRGLCTLMGGYYFTYEESHPIRFNPFFIRQGEVLDQEKKESVKTLLLALWKKDSDPFHRSEYVALSQALQLYYESLNGHPGVFPCFDSFYEFLERDFVAVLRSDRVKEKDFDVDNFLYVLRPYYRGGEFDYLLNARENLDLLSERFIVFELDNIKDHPILLPVVTIIIMEVFLSKMRKLKGVRKMILIEEAWKAIAREGMAEYIRYLFKTVRKYFGEAVVVTQEVEDIISSPVVKQAIVGNADCKILLDQSKYQNKFDGIQELLGLTEKEKMLVLSLNRANELGRRYKEVFISLGGVLSRVYRTEVSPEEYLTYTTEEKEKVRVMEYAKKFGSMQQGIKVLAAETEPIPQGTQKNPEAINR